MRFNVNIKPMRVEAHTLWQRKHDYVVGVWRSSKTGTMTEKAARGECALRCSDCCSFFAEGMPDKCPHNCQRCTDIIQRDKAAAQSKVDDCGRALS